MRISKMFWILTAMFMLFAMNQPNYVDAVEARSAPLKMGFSGQLNALCAELIEISSKDSKLKGRKLKLTKVVAATLDDSNFDLRVEEELKSRLVSILDTSSELLLSGELDYLESSSLDNSGFKVVQIKIKVVDAKRSELAVLSREINDTSDIARILQTTLAPPDTNDFAERNKAAAKAKEAPAFELIAGSPTQVSAVNFPRYSMEVCRHENGKSPSIPVPPTNENGLAFASIGIGDTYEVALYNYDEVSDAVVKLEIDGLDAANTFNSDQRNYPGYFIPRAANGKPGVHVISGWLNTVKPSDENVFKFVVNKLGEGVASKLSVRSKKTGFITATFFDACEPNGKLRGRNFGETGKGEGMRVDYQVKPVQIATDPLSIVTIRYTRSPAE